VAKGSIVRIFSRFPLLEELRIKEKDCKPEEKGIGGREDIGVLFGGTFVCRAKLTAVVGL